MIYLKSQYFITLDLCDYTCTLNHSKIIKLLLVLVVLVVVGVVVVDKRYVLPTQYVWRPCQIIVLLINKSII